MKQQTHTLVRGTRIINLASACALALVLTACGGGGGGGGSNNPPPNNPPPNNPPPDNPPPDNPPPDDSTPPPGDPTAALSGFYRASSGSQSFDGVIVDTGHFYLLARDTGTLTLYYGRGVGDASGSFISPGIRRFPLQPIAVPVVTTLASTVTLSQGTKTSISGALTPQTGGTAPLNFSGIYDAAYETAATLAAVQGTFTGTSAQANIDAPNGARVRSLTLTVKPDGSLEGISPGCAQPHTGKMTPRAKGNVYNVTLNFRYGTPCTSGVALTGHGVLDADGSLKVFVANNDFSRELFWLAAKRPQ